MVLDTAKLELRVSTESPDLEVAITSSQLGSGFLALLKSKPRELAEVASFCRSICTHSLQSRAVVLNPEETSIDWPCILQLVQS